MRPLCEVQRFVVEAGLADFEFDDLRSICLPALLTAAGQIHI